MSYNSYKTSPSYGSPGVSRGRGYSTRGSYRGRGVDSSSSWGSGNTSRGRGYSGPSRGRFDWYKEHSGSYDSRSRYTSGSSGVERYSSRGRGEDSGYRRYSRADTGDYSSPRDHRSPDAQRNRMRTDHGYVQASSTRRSHEGGYGGVTDYSSRYSYSEDKGSYGDERAHAYRDDRRSTGTYRSREEYPRRKSEAMESGMPPPSSIPPRHASSPRGSFRGRLSSRGARGMSRMFLAKRTNTILARKRSLADSYVVRKRVLPARTQADTLRRLRIIKLRRLREAAANRAAVSKKDVKVKEDGAKGTEDVSDEEEEGKMDEEEGELEEGETPDKKETPKKTKAEKIKDEEPEEGEDLDEDEDDEEEVDEEGKKTETKPNGNVHITIKQDSDARAISEESPTVRRTFRGKPFIKLTCPHCFAQCVTFQEYSVHLHTSRHISAMRKQSLRHKQTLADMRMAQREKQRVIEVNEEARGTLSARTKFCHVCKLNYRQLKSKHVTSEYHREMRKFLMPICYICHVEFKSPMLYENHLCSLDHIKFKAARAERQKRRVERLKAEHESSGAEEDDENDDNDLNLDNFMILDSVGDVDDAAEDGEGKSNKEKKEKEEKTQENLGSEHVHRVEVYFCDLCNHYLPRSGNQDKVLANHCRSRPHLQRYVRHRDDELLRQEAERIHRKRLAKKNAAKEAEAKKACGDKDEKMDVDKVESNEKIGTKTSEDTAGDSPKKKKEAGESKSADVSSDTIGESRDVDLDQDVVAGMDDKLWADVDKDLGELLREVEPGNKSSDEDDDSHAEGGRYDRFRYSEKSSVAVADPSSEDAVKAGEGTAEADAEDDKDEKPSESKGETDVPVKKTSVTTSSTPVTAAN